MNALKQKAAWENGFVSIANKALPFSSAVIMTLLMFSAGAWASLPSFRVSGTVTETQKLGELKPLSYAFTCTVDKERWSIVLGPAPESGPPDRIEYKEGTLFLGALNEVLSSDGTYFYHALGDNSALLGEEPDRKYANMGPGTAPFGPIKNVFLVIWYSYASSALFKDSASQTNRWLPALHLLRFEDVAREGFLMDGQWELLPGSPALPAFIQMSNFFGFLEPALAKRMRREPLPHTNLTFRVFESTNAASLVLPTHVECTYFFQRIDGGVIRQLESSRIELRANNFGRALLRDPFPPPPAGIVRVQYLGTWLSNPPVSVSLRMTNEWPVEGMLVAGYTARRDFERKRKSTPFDWRIIVMAVVVMGAPLLFLGKKFRKQP
jgi:hypothetical protein